MTVMDEISTRASELLATRGRAGSRTTTTRWTWWWPPASGAVLTDVDGVEYLDFLAAYSATNFGHGHPALVAAAQAAARAGSR